MLVLLKEYNLDKFNVSIYTKKEYYIPSHTYDNMGNIKEYETSEVVSSETLESLTAHLNNETYPRGIVEALEVLNGVKKIVISNKDNNILVVSANGSLDDE
jgi:hypothetical protein